MAETGRDWAGAKAPDLDGFVTLANAAYRALPETFRALTGEIIIEVADFPTEDVLKAMNCQTAFDLLGLFEGVGLAQAEAVPATGALPNHIWLYRRPILDYWSEHDETLGHVVAHVLIHEIGHHFGLSDDDMEAIEAAIRDDAATSR